MVDKCPGAGPNPNILCANKTHVYMLASRINRPMAFLDNQVNPIQLGSILKSLSHNGGIHEDPVTAAEDREHALDHYLGQELIKKDLLYINPLSGRENFCFASF